MRKSSGEIIITGQNVCVETAVTVTGCEAAAQVSDAFQSTVNNTTDLRRIAQAVKTEVPRQRTPVVDAAVGYVHDEPRSVELFLRESFACQPGQIARAAGARTGEIAGKSG